jgi:CheY-like chemotaxis protein
LGRLEAFQLSSGPAAHFCAELASKSAYGEVSSLQEPEQSENGAKKPGTVLIVDDNASHLKIYCWMLQRKGYECIPALVGSTSVQLPTSGTICMVLLDYRLNSALTAADVAEQVKTGFPSAPIVLLSELPWMPDGADRYAKAFVHKGEHELLFETVAKFCAGSA